MSRYGWEIKLSWTAGGFCGIPKVGFIVLISVVVQSDPRYAHHAPNDSGRNMRTKYQANSKYRST